MRAAVRKLRIEDVEKLQALVVEHFDAIEPGLTVLDARLLLGHATIDVIGVDSVGALVLGAVGFSANEDMLLKAVEAYSWCLEYPEALVRLYPSCQLSEDRPPRLLFVVERMPDAFHRKIKQLGFPEVDCVEVRHVEVDGVPTVYFESLSRIRKLAAPTVVERVPQATVPAPELTRGPVGSGENVIVMNGNGTARAVAPRLPKPTQTEASLNSPRASDRPTPSRELGAVVSMINRQTAAVAPDLPRPVIEPVVLRPQETGAPVPVAAEPKLAEPIVTKPSVTEAVVTTPVVIEPSTPEPVVTKPLAVELSVPEPVVAKPPVAEISLPEPVAVKPLLAEVSVPEPVAVKPLVAEVSVPEPVAVKPPVAVEPVTPEPVAAKPAIEPVAIKPTAVETPAVKPIVAEDKPVAVPTIAPTAARLTTTTRTIAPTAPAQAPAPLPPLAKPVATSVPSLGPRPQPVTPRSLSDVAPKPSFEAAAKPVVEPVGERVSFKDLAQALLGGKTPEPRVETPAEPVVTEPVVAGPVAAAPAAPALTVESLAARAAPVAAAEEAMVADTTKQIMSALPQEFEGLTFPNDGVLTRQWMDFLNQMSTTK